MPRQENIVEIEPHNNQPSQVDKTSQIEPQPEIQSQSCVFIECEPVLVQEETYTINNQTQPPLTQINYNIPGQNHMQLNYNIPNQVQVYSTHYGVPVNQGKCKPTALLYINFFKFQMEFYTTC